MVDLYVGVESSPGGVVGGSIRLASEMLCKPPWVLGASRPATHTFVCWVHDDGVVYRLDGRAPYASLALVPRLPAASKSRALWRLRDDCDLSIADAHRRAVSLAGAPYDVAEFVAQTSRRLAKLVFCQQAVICTSLAASVLVEAGGPALTAARSLKDYIPESFAQMMNKAEESWASRV